VSLEILEHQEMSPRPFNILERVAMFDRLPDDAVVPDPVAAMILSIDVMTLRRCNPIPQIRISERRVGRRVGDLRDFIRGVTPKSAA
jgi:hypothetical protein